MNLSSCEVYFKRQADHDGICNVCHGGADDTALRAAKARVIEQTRIIEEIVDELVQEENGHV